MEELSKPLRTICGGVDGALVASIMGVDGLPVDSFETGTTQDVDWSSLFVEYSSVLKQVKQSAEMLEAGVLEELSIRSERLTTIIRPLTSEYFVALGILPGGNSGKGRYLLKIHAPELSGVLS